MGCECVCEQICGVCVRKYVGGECEPVCANVCECVHVCKFVCECM